MPTTRSDRKRQTQLAFTPLPSSSPARAAQPPATRQRAAAVTIDGSPSRVKRRRLESSALLTPAKSSQNNAPASSESSDDGAGAAPRRRTTRSFLRNKPQPPAYAAARRSPPRRQELELFDDSESDPPPNDEHGSDDAESAASKNKVVEITDSDSDAKIPARRRKLLRKKRASDASSVSDDASGNEIESDESDDLPIVPKRKRRESQSTPKKQSRQVQQELDEDLEFLGSTSVDSPRALRGPASSPHKLARQKALAALKRRRSKQVPTSNAEREEQDAETAKDSEHEAETPPENYDSDDSINIPDPAIFHRDEYDEDFIDDENAVIGEKVELPFQFSQYKTMKQKELFKFAVEWMVQKKINPAFSMDDEVYQTAFYRLDDFVSGMRGSKFQSSAWTPGFTKSLRSRPVLEAQPYDNENFFNDRCDACNRSGHPATWEVRFTGSPYDKATLEEMSDDEDLARDDIPSEDTTYYIGRFCMRNARTAHVLAHWKHDLNEWVVDYLKDEGYCDRDSLLKRDGWSTRRKREYANTVVDEMETAGEIKRLYRDFKSQVEDAHSVDHDVYDRNRD